MNEQSDPAAGILDHCVAQIRRVAVQVLPDPVLDRARQALVDWMAVGLAGICDPEARALAETVHRWGGSGAAPTLDGRRASAPSAALINGAAAHTLDFDDFHIASLLHPGAPTLAAVLASGYATRRTGAEMLAAFVAGFEVGARCGSGGLGEAMAAKGWHPTSILGHLSAAAAVSALLKLDDDASSRALGLAAVQAGGLMAAAGSFAKPFAVGKAAMNGVIAAELASVGGTAPASLLDAPGRGLFGSLFQQPTLPPTDAEQPWLTLEDTFKPYPSCQLTHAAYEAGLLGREGLGDLMPSAVSIIVNPLAPVIACHPSPRTVLEARFSLPYCVALGLQGRRAVLAEFSEQGLQDPVRRELARRVSVVTDASVARWAARIVVETEDGRQFERDNPAALGSLDRPMGWSDLEAKFIDTVEPVLGSLAEPVLNALKRFDSAGASEELAQLLTRVARR